MKFHSRSTWLFFLLALCAFANAAPGDPLDLHIRYPHYYATIIINEDGTATESREWSMTVLKESALEWAKRGSVAYSTSVQKVEVLGAYTKKPDGRRIDAPKDNYQVQVNRGNDKDAPVFSDFSTLTVVFPEVAVGDTVVFSYRVVQTEPLFPKHFSLSETFNAQNAFDDVRVRIDYPVSLSIQHELDCEAG